MSQSLNDIVAFANRAAETDLEKNSAFRASVLLRDELEATGRFTHVMANEIAIQIKIKCNEDYTNEELLRFVVPFAKYLGKLAWAYTDHDFNMKDFLLIADTMDVEF